MTEPKKLTEVTPEQLAAEETILACLPVELSLGDMIDGSKISYCDRCQNEIYISPTGQAIIAEGHRVVTRCVPCAMKEMGEEANFSIAPGAREELAKNGLEGEELDDLLDRFTPDKATQTMELLQKIHDRLS